MKILCKLCGHNYKAFIPEEWKLALSEGNIEKYLRASNTCIRCRFFDEASYNHRLRNAYMIKHMRDNKRQKEI